MAHHLAAAHSHVRQGSEFSHSEREGAREDVEREITAVQQTARVTQKKEAKEF